MVGFGVTLFISGESGVSFANQSPREVETRITIDTHLKTTISTEARRQLRQL